MRHLMLCLVVLGFVAGQADRLRGEKPGGHDGASVPALNQCAVWQTNRRGTSKVHDTSEVISYHQQRNRAARLSRQRRTPMLISAL